MYKFYLSSTVDCNIFLDEKCLGVISPSFKQTLSLELETSKTLCCHPTNLNQECFFIPFMFKLPPENLEPTLCDEFCLDLLDNNYFIELKPKLYARNQTQSKLIFEKKFKDNVVSVHAGRLIEICISNKTEKTNYVVKQILNNIECTTFSQDKNDFLVVCACDCQNKKFALVANIQEKTFWKNTFDEISLNLPKIQTITDCNDISGHVVISTLEIKKDGIATISKFSSYKYSQAQKLSNPSYIALAFLQDVCVRDFAHARSFLSVELNSKLTDDTLKKFFPHSDLIKKCPSRTDTYVVCAKNENFYYSFETREQKIVNITQIN